jgi:hypothetical protein
MSSSAPIDDQKDDHQQGFSFVRSSVKSVIKALSGRRQSPSPSFQRSPAEVRDDAERNDWRNQVEFTERLSLATDEGVSAGTSPTFESTEVVPEIRLSLDESATSESVRSKMKKIRSLHGSEGEARSVENLNQVRESRYAEIVNVMSYR